MELFSKNEYCEMILLYGECGRKARLAARLYQQRFPAGPHPSHITILEVVKRKRETGCVTSRPRSVRPVKLGRQVQPEDVLSFAFTYPTSSPREISQNCGLSKSRVWNLSRHYWTCSLDTFYLVQHWNEPDIGSGNILGRYSVDG
ncbi:hypothetical protein AVEN_1175-1 [Araneus ventricosus]|uniref:DUF4817 domain-containing protein n=1 Tax=Araneus ventricosus TaxID=182803 RepID=A0A4Y2ECC4_ARAVE|nr:hypothetical protein AVEN_1175-1 [Araneus ventricosus]